MQMPDILNGSIMRSHRHILNEVWLADGQKPDQKQPPPFTCDNNCVSHEMYCTETCHHDDKNKKPEKQAFQSVVAGWSMPPAPPAL
jgi:hypothetical protein